MNDSVNGIGLLGGTFDPVHAGHLALAQAALAWGVSQVYWLPSANPPHKPTQVSAWRHRLAMLDRALATEPRFTQLSLPALGQPSYAIAYLAQLQALNLPQPWYWIMGEDTFQTLPRWYRCCEIVAQCQWLIAPRSPSEPDAALRPTSPQDRILAAVTAIRQRCDVEVSWHSLEQAGMSFPDISSRQIRQTYQRLYPSLPQSQSQTAVRSINPTASPQLPPCPPGILPSVHQYIVVHQLYRGDT